LDDEKPVPPAPEIVLFGVLTTEDKLFIDSEEG